MLMNPVTGGVDRHQITVMGGGYAPFAVRKLMSTHDAPPCRERLNRANFIDAHLFMGPPSSWESNGNATTGRRTVHHLMRQHGMGEHRTCKPAGFSRMTTRYQSGRQLVALAVTGYGSGLM